MYSYFFVVVQDAFTVQATTARIYKYTTGGPSSLTNEKDHHYLLNRFVCVGEFLDG